MLKFDPKIQYTSFTARANGVPSDIRSAVKVRLPLAYPSPTHDWTSTEALWDTGATHSVVSTDLAGKLKLSPIGKTRTIGIHGPKIVDVFLIDILMMDRVEFLTWQVSAGDTGPTTPNLIIGMDIITKGDMCFTRGKDGYVFSFIIPSLLQPIDFTQEIGRHNDDLQWKEKNKANQAEYRQSLRNLKKKR